jgi:hypothetical protein
LVADSIRKLVMQLATSSARGSGANLTPEAVNLALPALRAYRRRLAPRPVAEGVVSFQIEAHDDLNLPEKALATTLEESIARVIFAAAKRRFPAQHITLRGQVRSGERIAPVIRRRSR